MGTVIMNLFSNAMLSNEYFASCNTFSLIKEITRKNMLAGKSAEKGNETSALLMEVE